MARSRGVSIDTRVEEDAVVNALKSARREIYRNVRHGVKKAAEERALPTVRSFSPHIIRPFLTAKTRGTRAYITTRGPRRFDRIAGLLNYGGTVGGYIEPKHGMAVMTPMGPRRRVKKARRYHGKHFLEAGMAAVEPGIERAMLDEVMDSFDRLPHAP